MKTIILAFILSCVCLTANAQQAPQAFNFQGVAQNNGVAVANTAIVVRVTIIGVTSNGTALYSETHNPTTDAKGAFAIAIGQGSPLNGNFATIDWGGANHFLKIELDVTGSGTFVNLGTTQLLSVPYALYAAKAGSSVIANADTFWKASGQGSITYPGFVNIGSVNNPNTSLNTIGRSVWGGSIPAQIGISDGQPWHMALRLFRGSSNNFGSFHPTLDFHLDSTNAKTVIHSSRISSGTPDQPCDMIIDANNFGITSTPNFNAAPNNGQFNFKPKSKLHVNSGDVYLDNSANGVILTAPNGQCYRVTVSNTGTLTSTAITCP
jgi:hypothetical protein